MKSQVHECCSSAILSLARKMVSFSHNSRNVNLFEIQIIQVKLDLDINYDFSCNPAPLQGPTGPYRDWQNANYGEARASNVKWKFGN